MTYTVEQTNMIRHPILIALRDVTRELYHMSEGESCDHSVGICFCETFRAIEVAHDILRRNKIDL